MREELIKIGNLVDDARKAERRMNPEKARRLAADIRDLAAALAPAEPERCWCCGMRPNPRLNRLKDDQMAAMTAQKEAAHV